MRSVRWVSAHLVTPSEQTLERVSFWSRITDYPLQEPTPTYESRALLPTSGGAYLFAAEQDALEPDVRLGIHFRNAKGMRSEGLRHGGQLLEESADACVFMSPGGLIWTAYVWQGQRQVPTAATISPAFFEGYEVRTRVDQVAMDVPGPVFDREVEYWANLLGWRVIDAARPEYVALVDRSMPMRLMIHRDVYRDASQSVSIHLDVAGGGAADVDRLVAWHRQMGARLTSRQPWWVTMLDPTGGSYCLTRRDPRTGAIQTR